MVQHTTIALTQSIIALIAIITNASLQATSLTNVNKSGLENKDINYARQYLLRAILTQFIAAVLMITVAVLLMVYKTSLQEHMSKLLYVALILSGTLLLISGSLGAQVAIKLQCYRNNPNIEKAWKMSSITAVIGIVGTMLLLFIQAFVKRETIKEYARDYLINKTVKVPMYQPIVKKTNMPSFHPDPYSSDYNFD